MSNFQSAPYIENTMLMSFEMKFIRRDQKTRRNGEALPSHSAFLVKPDKLHIKRHLHGILFIMQ